MDRELYAIPVLLGCTLYVTVLALYPAYKLQGAVVSFLASFVAAVGGNSLASHRPRLVEHETQALNDDYRVCGLNPLGSGFKGSGFRVRRLKAVKYDQP